jgi:hypothetical protein
MTVPRTAGTLAVRTPKPSRPDRVEGTAAALPPWLERARQDSTFRTPYRFRCGFRSGERRRRGLSRSRGRRSPAVGARRTSIRSPEKVLGSDWSQERGFGRSAKALLARRRAGIVMSVRTPRREGTVGDRVLLPDGDLRSLAQGDVSTRDHVVHGRGQGWPDSCPLRVGRAVEGREVDAGRRRVDQGVARRPARGVLERVRRSGRGRPARFPPGKLDELLAEMEPAIDGMGSTFTTGFATVAVVAARA